MRATPLVGYRVLWLAPAVFLVLLSATGPAHATLSPDQGSYNREQLPLIVKPPESGPGGSQDPPPPGLDVRIQDPGSVTTVPEPGSLLLGLLGSGLVGGVGWRRRRRPTPCAESP